MNPTRRSLLAVAATASVAGCLAGRDSQPSAEGAISEAGTYIDDGVLDYVGLVDGAAEISTEGDLAIEYTNPEQRFEAVAGYRGEPDDGTNLRVSTDLSAAVPTVFPAPVYDADTGRFLIHVFANTEFVSFGEWESLVGWAGSIGREGEPEQATDIAFEELTDGVLYAVIDPEGTLEVAVFVDAETEPTGVVLRAAGRESVDIPQVSFEFDPNGEAVTITHGGGDHISADRLSITVGGQRVDATFDSDPVVAGSTATLNDTAVEGQTVRIILESEDGSRSVTLGEFAA